jgi:ABC-2 type transport system permease protein
VSHIWRVAWTIARRDYVAAVFSRLFLIFVLLPLIFGLIGGVFGAIGKMGNEDQAGPPPVVTVAGDRGLYDTLSTSRQRLLDRIHGLYLPPLVQQKRETTPHGDALATISGGLDTPKLTIAQDAPDELSGQVSLIVENARAAHTLGASVLPAMTVVRTARVEHDTSLERASDDRIGFAKGAQYGVLVLTIMLAGRLLSSFVEERSNKVIEVLAAVAPVDAIFLGKLTGMLLFSFTCIVCWGAIVVASGLLFAPQILTVVVAPAIGWPLFAPLLLLYFASCFLLQGAVLLGLGAQANSPGDLQTLALPTTIAQLMLLGFASLGVAHPDRGIAWAAAIFPWSSPLAMVARAVELPVVWPHLLALAWQALWLALTIRFAARRFRRGVLKSGGGKPARVSG